MSRLEFVDAHVHFYDMQHPELFYGHWQPGVPHPFLGDQIQKLAERNYLAEDYIAETRGANVTKAVHVQAAIGTEDPVKETEWLQQAADRTGFPHAIVAHADLREANVEAVLERHCRFPPHEGCARFLLRRLSRRARLSPRVRPPAEVRPGVEHAGAMAGDGQAPRPRRQLRRHSNRNRPRRVPHRTHTGVLPGLEARNGRGRRGRQRNLQDFGPRHRRQHLDRRQYPALRAALHRDIRTGALLFASNWPVDWLWSSYDAVVDAYTEIVSGFSLDEKVAMFSKNSEALYGI